MRVVVWLAAALLCLWVMAANVSPDFTPIRSELANAHGFSRGLLNFVVLSADQSFTRAPAWAMEMTAKSAAKAAKATRRSRGMDRIDGTL